MGFQSMFYKIYELLTIRPIKFTDGTTPHGDLSYDTLFATICPVVSEISGQHSGEEREE